MIYDCIIIGGGPAGLLASLKASEKGGTVAVIERNNILGKKLRITGKGRCNITNDCNFDTLMANIPGNPKFLFSAFKNFSNLDIIDFFNDIGLETVTERGGIGGTLKYLRFTHGVAADLGVAFSYSAVTAVADADVGKFDQSAQIHQIAENLPFQLECRIKKSFFAFLIRR